MKTPFTDRTIGLRGTFTLLMVGVLSLTLLLSSLFMVQAERESYRQHLADEARTLGRFVALVSPEAMLAYDYATLNNYVREVSQLPDMVHAIILDQQKNALTTHLNLNDSLIQAAIESIESKSSLEIAFWLEQQPGLKRYSYPISYTDRVLGHVQITVSDHGLYDVVQQRLLGQLTWALPLLMLIGAGIYGAFHHSVMRQVRHLTAGSERVAKGKLDQFVEVVGRNELAVLAQRFNSMMVTIADERRHLKQLNEELEVRVQARTQELLVSNQKLHGYTLELEKTQQQLQQERAFLQSVIDGVPEPIMVIDLEYKVLLANSTARSEGGQPGLGTLYCYQISHHRQDPCCGEEHGCPLEMVKNRLQATRLEHVHYDKEGNPRQVEILASPLQDAQGELIGMIEATRDVTERHLVEQEIQRSHELIRTIDRFREQFIEEQDEEALFNAMIRALMKLTDSSIGFIAQYRVQEEGVDCLELLSFAQQSQVDTIDHAVVAGETLRLSDVVIQRIMTRRRTVVLNQLQPEHSPALPFDHAPLHAFMGIPIFYGIELLGIVGLGNAPEGYADKLKIYIAPAIAAVGQVMTAMEERKTRHLMTEELKRAKQQAEEASQAKTQFLATMSHEIRTPMNVIVGVNELLLESEQNAVSRHYLEVSYSAGEALLSLINDILDLSKIEAGEMAFEFSSFQLHEMMEQVVSLFRIQAQEKGLSLQMQLADEVPLWCQGDAVRLRQVLINLIGNAFKFTREGSVDVLLEALSGDRYRFSVQDTGIGIPEDKLDHVFDPFSQADSSTTRRYGGSGLGLTICRRIVENMGGAIGVESREGQGSRFYFDLPLATAKEPALQLPRGETPLPLNRDGNAAGLRILVAEDSEDNVLLLKAYFKGTPHEVSYVVNGVEAVHAYRQGAFQLLLMDLQMPEMDGYTATREIRQLEREERRPRTPIYALSAHAFTEARQHSLDAGCDGHLTKPIRKQKLLSFLAELMEAG
uniref:histidine kinase n=1 Tax=Magnetococcus massalia (strain MO-1) TaxID=451514 RepID=A0A1S7LFF2_MAGMO|nr:putative Histidine kinase with HAMP domain, PAS sensor domain and response regulator receiver domain [Candidatus Magnetococcus massalia]